MWKSLALKELKTKQVAIVQGRRFPAIDSVLRAWQSPDLILTHEHMGGRSRLRSYNMQGKLLFEWPNRGWPQIKFCGDKVQATFESYSRKASIVKSQLPGLHFLINPNKSPTFALLSLHGGPESIEVDERRYDGWYEDVIRAGGCIAIWNYPGSVGFGKDYREHPHRRWLKVIHIEGKKVLATIKKTLGLNRNQVIWFGPSFGATLAWHLSAHFEARGQILVNPVSDIPTQAIRARQSGEHSWFDRRFDLRNKELSACTLVEHTNYIPSVFVLSTHDEVADYRATRKTLARISEPASFKICALKSFRHTPRSKASVKRLKFELNKGLQFLLSNG
jgi:predicted esterase YcpF (UPF0227 family)